MNLGDLNPLYKIFGRFVFFSGLSYGDFRHPNVEEKELMVIFIHPLSSQEEYHHDGLLFQFITKDFLSAYPEAISIAESCQGLTQNGDSQDAIISQVISSLIGLVGGAFGDEYPLPWSPIKGSLGKLKHWCQLYHGPKKMKQGAIADLKANINATYHATLQARELIQAIRAPIDPQRQLADLKQMKELFHEVARRMGQLANQLQHLIEVYRYNENILLFLLRYASKLDRLYNEPVVSRVIAQAFQGGLSEAKQYLATRYSERGFDHILPSIEQYADQLDGQPEPLLHS